MKFSFGNFWRLTVIFAVLLGSLLLPQNALGLPPTAPLNLRIGSSPPTTTTITLAWDPPSSNGGSAITGYKIERAGQTTPPTFDAFSTLVANTGTATTSFSDTGLSAGQLFKYKVSAINSDGTGPASAEFIMGTQFPANQQFSGTQTFQPGQVFSAGTTFAAGQEFTGTQTFGANQQFGAGTKFAQGQTFSGTQTFTASNIQFGSGTTFNSAQTFGAGARFDSGAQTFVGANTFGANTKFGAGQTFGATQTFGTGTEFTGTVDFATAQAFAARAKFAAGQDFPAGETADFTAAALKFGSGTTFGTARTFGQFADFSTGTQTFSGTNTFGEGALFGTGQTFGAAQTFAANTAFGKNTVFSVTQNFPAGAQFDAGTQFANGQSLSAGEVPSYGILLNAITCGTNTDASCVPSDASKYLAPGKRVSAGTDPAAVEHSITSSSKSFSVAGLGVDMAFDSVTTDGKTSVDVLDPASATVTTGTSAVTTPLFGSSTTDKRLFSIGGSNFQNVGSVMEISLDGAAVTGSVRVTVPYDDTGMSAGQEANLKLLHKPGGSWQAESGCTVDTVNNKVTCTVTSLSPFTVGSDGSSATTATGGDVGRFVPPSFTGSVYGQSEYPLTIAGKSFTLPNFYNPITTNVIQAGQPTPIKLLIYSSDGPSAIKHVALFTNLNGVSRDVQNSDTFISYDADQPLQIVDPHGLFANATVNVTPNNNKLEVDFTITFAKPMPKSDIIIRSWDTYRASSDIHVANAIEVLGNPVTSSALTTKNPINNMTLTATNSSNLTPSASTVNQTNSQTQSNPDLMSTIRDWGGYSAKPISDSQFLEKIGIKASTIPSWVIKTTKWVISGDITGQEFVNAVKYLYDNGIIQ